MKIAKIVAYDEQNNELAHVIPCTLPEPSPTDHRFDGHDNQGNSFELISGHIEDAFVELIHILDKESISS